MARAVYHTEQFIKAIPGTGGIISTIANRVGCDWHTAKKYIVNHPTVARAYQDECEKIGDLAETGLYTALRAETERDESGKVIRVIKPAEPWAVKFYLTTKARSRGYVLKQEVELSGEVQTQMIFYIPENGRDGADTDQTTAGGSGDVPEQPS